MRLTRGSFSPSSLELVDSGYFNQEAGPRVITFNGKTYIGSITAAGTVEIRSLDHATGVISAPTVLASSLTVDVHNSIAIGVRPWDGKIVVAWSSPVNATSVKHALSTNAEDISSFGAAGTLFGVFTYTQLVHVPNESNAPFYLFTQQQHLGVTVYMGMSKSTDGGATFSAFERLIGPGAGADAVYFRTISDDDKTHIFVTDTNSTEAEPASLYHFIFQNGVLYKSDGTSLGSSFPVAATSGTLVHDELDGPTRSLGAAIDGSGNPATMISIYDTINETLILRVARWTGSAWQVDDVTDSNGLVLGTYRMSEACLDRSNPNVCYVSKRVGPTYWEMFRYESSDNGATWAGEALTHDSANHHVNPDTPVDAGPLKVIWGYGEGTSLDFVITGSRE